MSFAPAPTTLSDVWTSFYRDDPSFPHQDPSFPHADPLFPRGDTSFPRNDTSFRRVDASIRCVPTTYPPVRTLIRSGPTMIQGVPTTIQAVPKSSATRVTRKGGAEAAFWRSAVWLPAEAARVADRLAGIGPTDATRDGEGVIDGTAGSRGVNGCGGTPTKRASAYSLLSTCASALPFNLSPTGC